MSEPTRTMPVQVTREPGAARLEPPFAAGLPRVSARAPARLDVMGGITDLTGGLSLSLPLSCGARVTVQRRGDRRFVLRAHDEVGSEAERELSLACAELFDAAGRPVPMHRWHEQLAGEAEWAVPVVALLVALAPPGPVRDWADGATIAWDGDARAEQGISAQAALQVACCEALAAVYDVALDPQQVVEVCRRADMSVREFSCGPLDALTCLIGQPESLLCAGGQAGSAPYALRLPGSLCILGVDAGVRHPQAERKFCETRVSAMMGAAIIDYLNRRDMPGAPSIDGNLARISQGHFVSRYRDQLPTRIRGSEFLQRYGPLADPLVDVEPDAVYKVRSRTEHHIYDHERTQQYLSLIRRAASISNARWLEDAGHLMNCSHWSYGQRCGLSTIELDVLVNLLQQQGVARGIYGARVSGRGAGGAVAVLMHNSPAAREAVSRMLDEYGARTGRQARVLEPGWCGARPYGVQQD